jgi:hypothetical protein
LLHAAAAADAAAAAAVLVVYQVRIPLQSKIVKVVKANYMRL